MAIEAKTLKGFRDYLPDAMAPRQAMIRTIEGVFERQGFLPLMTPALEYAETLTGKYGAEGDKLLYQFEDHGKRQVALRYDLTVPLARVVAEHRNELQLPFRRYQIAPVWRADKPQRGRFREFMQCDADIVGANSALADAEVLGTGLAVLDALGIREARLHLNHRDVLSGLLQGIGVPAAQQLDVIRAIDKLDKIGRDGVGRELQGVLGLTSTLIETVLAMFGHDLGQIEAYVASRLDETERARFVPAFERVRQVLELLTAAGHEGRVVFDPTIARGLDYYTGVIYETRLTEPKVAGIGAVMSGGRYDGLIGMFAREQIPAVGISLGLDRLLAALQELGLVRGQAGPAVYATVFGPGEAAAMVRAVQALRVAGIAVELDTMGGKLGKQLERGGKRGCRVALVMGSAEAAEGQVLVKDLHGGAQERVALADLASAVRGLLAH